MCETNSDQIKTHLSPCVTLTSPFHDFFQTLERWTQMLVKPPPDYLICFSQKAMRFIFFSIKAFGESLVWPSFSPDAPVPPSGSVSLSLSSVSLLPLGLWFRPPLAGKDTYETSLPIHPSRNYPEALWHDTKGWCRRNISVFIINKNSN